MLKKKIKKEDIDISKIPPGPYCYFSSRCPDDLKFKPCPYWDCDPDKGSQEFGYCHYLQRGDWEEINGMGLLWDQVKECGINTSWEKRKNI